jgi:hypothetical protein
MPDIHVLTQHLELVHVREADELIEDAFDAIYFGPQPEVRKHFRRKEQAAIEVLELQRLYSLPIQEAKPRRKRISKAKKNKKPQAKKKAPVSRRK